MTKIDFFKICNIWKTVEHLLGVWVFGSGQKGFLQQNSDLDFGLLFSSLPTIEDLTTLRARLQLALSVEEIDLIVLNDVNPILKFEAISGNNLFCHDLDKCAAFVSLCAREYEEAMAFLKYGMACLVLR